LNLDEELAALENDRVESLTQKEPPKTMKELKFALIDRRKVEIKKINDDAAFSEPNAKKIKALSPIICSMVLQEYLTFALFDMGENTRLAMYLLEDGIYTQNETYIRRVIGWLEPTLNANRASEVIYHLWKGAEVRERTNSRYLIPVNNGVFNLKTKKLEPFSEKYVFTAKLGTNYVEKPKKPRFKGWDVEKWIDEISCNDKQLSKLLWQVINDSMNSNFSRRKSIWLVGDGNNGKGTFQQLIINLIGQKNIATLKIDQFQERFALSMLEERVCCIGDDVQEGIYIDDSSNFNSVVTGDLVMIEQKNKPAYASKFNMTIIQSTNGMPKIKNKSNGTYRRVLIVPFNANFQKENDNWSIKNEYIYQASLLEYVLNKAINMDFEQFSIPDASEQLLWEYKQENDPLIDFKVNTFDALKAKAIPFYIVYGYYKDFCNENNYQPLSKIKFSRKFDKLLDEDNWEKVIRKYKSGEIGRNLNLPYNVDAPVNGQSYQSYVNNKLKAI
jgi:putative DNA primase/helicase